jgi:hypothetical protein
MVEVEVSASGCSIDQRSSTDCGVSECDFKASKMRKLWPTSDCRVKEKRECRKENIIGVKELRHKRQRSVSK